MERASNVRTAPRFELEAYLESRRSLVDAGLEGAIEAMQAPEPLQSALRYAALSPGKRLRPVMTLAAAEAVADGRIDKRAIDREALFTAALPLGCAVELIHAYSLVHDDLPAMDDDDLRRGRPTLHIAFDEATAILAGDALLTEAFRLVGRAPGLKRSRRGEAAALLAEAAGANGMVGGQMLDLAAEGRYAKTLGAPAVDLAKLEMLASCKTGALIAGAAGLGALAGGAGPVGVRRLQRYGAAVGLAFQIVDDLLDEESTEEQMGKATGKDAAKGKVTFPQLLGREKARAKAEALAAKAVRIAERYDNEGGQALAGIARWAVRRTK